MKVANDSLELQAYLRTLEPGTLVAVEASGSWYWFVDRLEEAVLDVRLVNPLEAKKRMGGRNKTDLADAGGLALLLRNGTLPEVWIPPARWRDLRGLLRTRLALRHHTTILKDRIHAAIRRYGQYEAGEPRNLFVGKGRVLARTQGCGVIAKPGTKMLMLPRERIDDSTAKHVAAER